jgi:transcription antitermination factor NusA-like protein
MDHSAALKVIRDCFAHVEVERIFVEYDSLAGGEVAKVVVRDDQLSEALRGNGEHARRAAMQSGLTVEVMLVSEQAGI